MVGLHGSLRVAFLHSGVSHKFFFGVIFVCFASVRAVVFTSCDVVLNSFIHQDLIIVAVYKGSCKRVFHCCFVQVVLIQRILLFCF